MSVPKHDSRKRRKFSLILELSFERAENAHSAEARKTLVAPAPLLMFCILAYAGRTRLANFFVNVKDKRREVGARTHAAARAREDAADGLDLRESDTMGGGDSFRETLARANSGKQRRQTAKTVRAFFPSFFDFRTVTVSGAMVGICPDDIWRSPVRRSGELSLTRFTRNCRLLCFVVLGALRLVIALPVCYPLAALSSIFHGRTRLLKRKLPIGPCVCVCVCFPSVTDGPQEHLQGLAEKEEERRAAFLAQMGLKVGQKITIQPRRDG